MKYDQFIERMRKQQHPIFNTYIECSQPKEDILTDYHIENRGNKVIITDNISQQSQVITI